MGSGSSKKSKPASSPSPPTHTHTHTHTHTLTHTQWVCTRVGSEISAIMIMMMMMMMMMMVVVIICCFVAWRRGLPEHAHLCILYCHLKVAFLLTSYVLFESLYVWFVGLGLVECTACLFGKLKLGVEAVKRVNLPVHHHLPPPPNHTHIPPPPPPPPPPPAAALPPPSSLNEMLSKWEYWGGVPVGHSGGFPKRVVRYVRAPQQAHTKHEWENFCAISCEYHRACIRQLGYMHVLANTRLSGPVSVKYRPSKLIFSMDTDTNVYVAVCYYYILSFLFDCYLDINRRSNFINVAFLHLLWSPPSDPHSLLTSLFVIGHRIKKKNFSFFL